MDDLVTGTSSLAAGSGVSPGYNFSAPSGGQQPYVYYVPSGFSWSAPFDVTLFIDNVFAVAPSGPISSGPFTLQPTVQSDNQPGLPYKVVVPGTSSAWSFDGSPIRQGVQDAFVKFLVALENNNNSTQLGHKLKPGRLQLVRQYLAQVLPQTFAETLWFRYGLDPGNRCIDLLPGMRLRIEFQAHQALDPQQDPLNGFVGSGQMLVDVATTLTGGGSVNVALGTFLPRLQGMVVAANTGGAGGTIDFQGQAFAYPYYRLLYPQNYPSSDGTGFVGIQQNPTVLAAASYADLVAATSSYLSKGTVTGQATAAFFRGRAAVVPEIPVFVQGVVRHVTVGTTIRQLLSGLAAVPYMDTGKVSLPSQFYTRQHTALLGQQSPPQWAFQPGQSATSPFVNLQSQPGGYACYGYAPDSFDLPVLGGDSLSIPIPSAR